MLVMQRAPELRLFWLPRTLVKTPILNRQLTYHGKQLMESDKWQRSAIEQPKLGRNTDSAIALSRPQELQPGLGNRTA
jgi:hypothetical protein